MGSSPPFADDVGLVSVVMPARNEEASIRMAIRSVQTQTYEPLELLVVDGASEDRTSDIVREIAARDDRVRLLTNPGQTIPRAMNIGVAEARGRWLVRLDAHSSIPPDYVALCVEHLRTSRWGGVGGRKDGVGTSAKGRAIAAALSSRFGVGDSLYHYGTRSTTVDHVPFGAYPMELAREVGGWDERLTTNEDYEFDYRVRARGFELLFDPRLRIRWHVRESIGDLFNQYHRYGRGKAKMVWLNPRSVKARHLAAPALCVAAVAALVLAPVRPKVAAAIVTPYIAANAAASILTSKKVHGEAARWLPGAFVAMHIAWGLGFWRGTIEHLRRS